MNATYLVEIRLSRTKWRIRKITEQIARESGIRDFLEPHPHVTLYGPLTLNNGISSRDLLDAIATVAARYDPVPFLIDGWEKRDGIHGSVIAFPVRPSEELCRLTREIAAALSPITTSQNSYDADPEMRWFHVTIANRLSARLAEEVYAHLTGPAEKSPQKREPVKKTPSLLERFLGLPMEETVPASRENLRSQKILPVLLDETGIRITVMQDMAILGEYDLIEKRWVFGDYRHSAARWQKTLGHYRHHAGFEHRDPEPPRADDVFVIADLHLGHANIIRYCSRPFLFSDSAEMDHVLIKNWNYTVSQKNRVYYLGDFRYGPDAEPAVQYRKRLRGDIVFIRGNHDDSGTGTVTHAKTVFDGTRFFLVHDPADAPPGFDGWVIHGHHHNNDLRNYPFMNFACRRVNVSAEVVGYTPVGLHEIVRRIREREATGDTAPALFRYEREHG